MRVLTEYPDDNSWLTLIEIELGERGEQVIEARRRTITVLQNEIENHQGAFPKAVLALTNDTFDANDSTLGLRGALMHGFYRARERDAAAGRSLYGPHRMDLMVIHRDKLRQAAECSTGEQKALLLNIILAQGARLAAMEGTSQPVLLLDEVAAHLDPIRRHALFDETHALGLQTFFTGTDQGLFDGLRNRALGVRVEAGQFIDFVD